MKSEAVLDGGVRWGEGRHTEVGPCLLGNGQPRTHVSGTQSSSMPSRAFGLLRRHREGRRELPSAVSARGLSPAVCWPSLPTA